MPTTRIVRWAGIALAALSLALVLAACGGSDSDKAGGAAGGTKAGQPVVLSMASAIGGGQPEQLRAFVDEVARLSSGARESSSATTGVPAIPRTRR